jgi:hypothetical protein
VGVVGVKVDMTLDEGDAAPAGGLGVLVAIELVVDVGDEKGCVEVLRTDPHGLLVEGDRLGEVPGGEDVAGVEIPRFEKRRVELDGLFEGRLGLLLAGAERQGHA